MSFGDCSIAGGYIRKTWKKTQSAHFDKSVKSILTQKNKGEGPPTYHIWAQTDWCSLTIKSNCQLRLKKRRNPQS
jgi:hypothetical protein